MTADDPRVKRARELAETYAAGRMDSNIEDDLLASVRDLLDVVGELRTLRMMAHDLQTEATLRARAAEAEVERLRRWKGEAAEVMLGLQDLGKALGVPYGRRITGEAGVEAAEKLRTRAEAAEAERDELLASRAENEE